MTPLAFLEGGFLSYATSDPVYYFSWVLTVVVSVTLHELGHGLAALRQGDDTPRTSGHMTLNPLVHMGVTSLIFLFVVGIAWGMMPVNPSRFRSRYGDAIVSFAGPAVNLVLALAGLTVLGLLIRFGLLPDSDFGANLGTFLLVFGTANLVLFVLNLIPLPPLDGSRVLAGLVPPYRKLVSNPDNQGVYFVMLIALVVVGGKYLWGFADGVRDLWLRLMLA